MLIKAPPSLADIKPRTDRFAPKADAAQALPEAVDEEPTSEIPDSVFEVKPRNVKAASNKQAKESPIALGAKPTAEDAAMLKNMSVSERFKLLNSRAKAAAQSKPASTPKTADSETPAQPAVGKSVEAGAEVPQPPAAPGKVPSVPEKAPLGVATFSFGAISPLKQVVGPGLSGAKDSTVQKEQAHG